MKRYLVAALLLSGLGVGGWQVGIAQGQYPTNSFEAKVALVDIAHIYKNYKVFTDNDAIMKQDAKDRETKITQAQQALKGLLAQRNQFKPGTTNYQQKEVEIAKAKAELDLMVDGARQEFQLREAALYHKTYKEIEAAISAYARSKGITLVLRTARDEATDPDKPQEVLKQISQQVVFSSPNMDITESILQMLNRGGASVRNTPTQRSNTTPLRSSNSQFQRNQLPRNTFKK